jgi:hypothetical protein
MTTLSAAASRPAADLVRHLQRMTAFEGAFAVRLQLRYPIADRSRPWLGALFREPLEPLAAAGDASIYALADTDHVVLCDALSLDLVDDAVVRLNGILPAPDEERGQADAGSVNVSWFDLSRIDHRDAVARLAAEAAAADARAGHAPLRPIGAADLPSLADLLTADRLAPLLRSQRALLIRSATDIRLLYTEIAVSTGALQRTLAPGLDLRARPSLFRCLGDKLDKAMLAALTNPAVASPVVSAEAFSLGLGLTTLAAPEFAAFAAALAASSGDEPPRALIRIRLDDVLVDFDAFAAARDQLHGQGFRVVLDNLTPMTLDLLDPAGFGADFVKVRFPAGTHDDDAAPVEQLSEAVRRIGRERLIFADIDNEAMVMEALRLGVRRFQGRFIDELVAAMLAKGWL